METGTSLLEQALNHKVVRKSSKQITESQRELAVAWAEGKVSISQVAGALNIKSGGVYPFLAFALRAVHNNPESAFELEVT